MQIRKGDRKRQELSRDKLVCDEDCYEVLGQGQDDVEDIAKVDLK